MTLSEKILYCRKKAGLSQEALADMVGVSRQSVSKWETGDAAPEIGKLLQLSKAFDVTTDWLLSQEEPEQPQQPESAPVQNSTWVDSVPGVIGKLIRRYGWLYGVYTALAGLGFVVIGALAKIMTRRMFSSFPSGMEFSEFFGSNSVGFDEAGNMVTPFGPEMSFAANNPVSTMGTVIIVIGVVFIIAGVVLAVYLKNHGQDGDSH